MSTHLDNLNQISAKISYFFKKTINNNDTILTEEERDNKIIVFISYGSNDIRAKVWNTAPLNADIAIKKTLNYIKNIYEKNNKISNYLKIDIVHDLKKIKFKDLLQIISEEKLNNYFRKGIAFDENFSIALLEQEIYGNAIIQGKTWDKASSFNEINLNKYLKHKYNISSRRKIKDQDLIYTFRSKGIFFKNLDFYELNYDYINNGIRTIDDSEKRQSILEIIKDNCIYLNSQIDQETGKFIYGYIPANNERLTSYNSIRHCTSLYSLLEAFEVSEKFINYDKIKKGINYTIKNLIKYPTDQSSAFIIEQNKSNIEIKLGANAAAILMFTKYQEVTGSTEFLLLTEKLANGIKKMIKPNGKTIHILDYPSLEVKEEYRVIYYDGEAALALLRLYQLNNDQELLKTVKIMYEHFIDNYYWKYNDHWLSYCTNELSLLCPEKKYFEFGIQNYLPYLKRYKNRRTARGTFLEMLMASYKMVSRLPHQEGNELFEKSKFSELCDVINTRLEYQRVIGYFYPEIAMYFKKPNIILNSFFVRQENFRTRIDDNEHNLSGYIAYYLHFKD